jgi:hypothetical protein
MGHMPSRHCLPGEAVVWVFSRTTRHPVLLHSLVRPADRDAGLAGRLGTQAAPKILPTAHSTTFLSQPAPHRKPDAPMASHAGMHTQRPPGPRPGPWLHAGLANAPTGRLPLPSVAATSSSLACAPPLRAQDGTGSVVPQRAPSTPLGARPLTTLPMGRYQHLVSSLTPTASHDDHTRAVSARAGSQVHEVGSRAGQCALPRGELWSCFTLSLTRVLCTSRVLLTGVPSVARAGVSR